MTGDYLYRLTTCPRCGHVASMTPSERCCWRCQVDAIEARWALATFAVLGALGLWAVLL